MIESKTSGRTLALLCLAACALGGGSPPAHAQARPLDELAAAPPAAAVPGAAAGWEPAPAEGVRLALSPAQGPGGGGVRLAFDFQGRGGYAIARKRLALDLPDNYEIACWVRGETPRNNLEVKLLDASGDNVWWSVRRDFEFPREWRRLVVKKRQLSFAWGPAGGGEIRHASAIEVVVSAGEGGKGTVEVSGLSLEPLAPPHPYTLQPIVSASSAAPGSEPRLALDGDPRTGWHSLPGAAEEQWLAIDFGERRELGGLAIAWDGRDSARRFELLTSRDGAAWEVARVVDRGGGSGARGGGGGGCGAGGGGGGRSGAGGGGGGTAGSGQRVGRGAGAVRAGSEICGGKSYLYLPDTDARLLRLRLLASSRGRGYGVREITVEPVEISSSANAFFQAVARDSPRGSYPRTLWGEQAFWTVVGVDGGRDQALLNEDGLLEAGQAGFSVEPFVRTGGALVSWSDVRSRPSLAAGYLPMPSVRWEAGERRRRADTEPAGARAWRRAGLTLEVTTFGAGPAERPVVYARYRLRNRGARTRRARLFLVVRPFQVNPPWQWLNRTGGAVEVRRIAFDGRAVTVAGDRTAGAIVPLAAPAAFGAGTFDQGSIADLLRQGRVPAAAAVADPFGYASAALAYDLRLAPGATGEVDLALPLGGLTAKGGPLETAGAAAHDAGAIVQEPVSLPGPAAVPAVGTAERRLASPEGPAWSWAPDRAPSARTARLGRLRVARLERQVAAAWRARLGGVELGLPPAARPLGDTLRTALAHILVSREGPALRPGTRSYARSWIRDGALMSEALLRLGHAEEVREFAAWYAAFQGEGGKVPCCVDRRGADPVPENDSGGELLYLLASYWRYSGDRAFLAAQWAHVEGAVAYLDALRQQRRGAEWREGAKLAFFGLLPESISHEGYSAHPEHSYWDDFFALRGLSDAAEMAHALGKDDLAARWGAMRDEFRRDLLASLRRTIAAHAIDYIPGSVELGDFDATSTTIALAPAGELANLPAAELRRTFERYDQEVRQRGAGAGRPGEVGPVITSYTPYELRAVGAFVRLGWRERAQELLAGFMADRTPPEWNQWPEVVWKPARYPGYLGDLPHAWVAAEFIRSFLDLLAYEREADHALVVAAGVPAAWAEDPSGLAVRHLATPYGTVGFRLTSRGGEARLHLEGSLRMPPGGLVVAWPFGEGRQAHGRGEAAAAADRLTVNGRPAVLTAGGELVVRELPADVRLRR